MSAAQNRELVILIHGTGSPDPDDASPKWWQPESAFAKDLRARLGSGFDVGETPESAPFCWSGRNSERDRRAGGKALFRRLRQLEAKRIPYHLVGHSHGGSVIWHMLGKATARGAKLNGLRSWTTVGTPFLEFAPLWHGLLTFVAAAFFLAIVGRFVVGIYGAMPWAAGSQAWWRLGLLDDIRWQDITSQTGKWLFIIQLTLVALVMLYLAVASLRWLGRWISHRWRRTVEAVAARRFRERWLGLWHQYDEPLNGLSATLITPIWFAPRGTTSRSHWLWRTLSWPWNRLVAPAIDQYVWKLTMGRLQGGDIWGLSLVDAAAAPRALRPGWPQLTDPVAQEMWNSAGERAATTAGELRKKLALLRAEGEGHDAVHQMATAISWSEILHTCYFDHPSVRELITSQVLRKGVQVQSGAVERASQSMKWLTDDHRLDLARLPKPFRPLQLALTRVTLILALAFVLGVGLLGTYVAFLREFSGEWQITQLTSRATSSQLTAEAGRQLTDEGGVSLVGDVYVRLEAIAKSDSLRQAFSRFIDPNVRVMVAERLAYALGHAGQFEEVEKVIEAIAALEKEDGIGDLAVAGTALRVYALAGAHAGDQKVPKEAFIQATINGLAGLKQSSTMQPSEMAKLFALSLDPLKHYGNGEAALGYVGDVADLFETMAKRDCKEFARWAGLVTLVELPEKAVAARAQCDQLPPQRFKETSLELLMRDENYREAAQRVIAAVPKDDSKPDKIAELVGRPWQLLGYGQLLLAHDEADAASLIVRYFLRKPDLSSWSPSPLETMMAAQALGQLCTRLDLTVDPDDRLADASRWLQLNRFKSEANRFAVELKDSALQDKAKDSAAQDSPEIALKYAVAAILYREIYQIGDATRTLQAAFNAAQKYSDPNERLLITLFLSQLAKEMDTFSIARSALELVPVRLRDNPATNMLIVSAEVDAQVRDFRLARRTAELAGPPTGTFFPGMRPHGGVFEGYMRILDKFIAYNYPAAAKSYGVDRRPDLVKVHGTAILRPGPAKLD